MINIPDIPPVIFRWVVENMYFIVFNWGSHLVAGAVIATIIFPFLSKQYKKRINYFLFVFFPALFGSDFPDLLFVISTFIKNRTLEGMRVLLESGGSIHSVFHKDIPLLLVIPTTVFFVLVIIYAINGFKKIKGKIIYKFFPLKKQPEKISLDNLPGKWLILVSIIALLTATLHIIMDMVGF